METPQAHRQTNRQTNRQTVLITGASSGIGAATAAVFARQGYDLLLMGRDRERLEKTAQACPGARIELLIQDLNQLDEQALRSSLKKLAPLSVLVNNAGIYQQASLADSTRALWENMFQTNLMSAVLLTQIVWTFFSEHQRGSIVNVSSTLGVKPIPHTAAYSAMKAAMINWTLALAQEGGPLNIRANCVCPGIIDTPIHPFHHLNDSEKKNVEKQITPLQLIGRWGKPEDVAESIFFLASDKSSFTTGSVLYVDGGIQTK